MKDARDIDEMANEIAWSVDLSGGKKESARLGILKGMEIKEAEIASLRKQLEDARGSLYQCYRSSREDALESHPDWAEHIADINRESGEAIARIDEALKGKS